MSAENGLTNLSISNFVGVVQHLHSSFLVVLITERKYFLPSLKAFTLVTMHILILLECHIFFSHFLRLHIVVVMLVFFFQTSKTKVIYELQKSGIERREEKNKKQKNKHTPNYCGSATNFCCQRIYVFSARTFSLAFQPFHQQFN